MSVGKRTVGVLQVVTRRIANLVSLSMKSTALSEAWYELAR